MATTERRRSISGFFGFRQEPKVDPENAPRLRRKLQKVSKQANMELNGSGAGGVQTVQVPGDGSFLSTKYDPVPPPKPTDGNSSDENSRSGRESRSKSFFRSSSLSRVTSFRSRSASRSRPTSTAVSPAADARPAPTAVPVPTIGAACSPSTGTGPIQVASSAELHAVRVQEKAARAAAQTRTLQCLEAHERASRRNSFYGNSNTSAALPSQPALSPSALPQTTALQPPPVTPPQQMPQFHRPYRHAQQSETSPPADGGRKHSYPPRSSNAFHKSMSLAAHYPSPASSAASTRSVCSSASSSAGSSAGSSSGSLTALSSPTSSTHSSAPMSSTSTLLFSPAYNNGTLPPSPPASSASSSCPNDGFAAKSSPFSPAYSRQRNSSDGYPMMPPELSYLAKANSNGSTGPDSPLSPYSMTSAATSAVSSTPSQTQTRRKIKTPVYAIGQLESAQNVNTNTTDSNSGLAQEQGPRGKHEDGSTATGMQTPPRSPRSSRSPRSPAHFRAAPPTALAELSLLQSRSSIECIAEEYRALLASRNSQRTDPESEAGTGGFRPSPLTTARSDKYTQSGYNGRSTTPGAAERRPRAATPLHSRGKRQPSQLAPLSTEHRHSYGQPCIGDSGSGSGYCSPPLPQADNLSLQISLDLLTRELSSAMGQHPAGRAAPRTSAGAGGAARHGSQQEEAASEAGSALQILVMIEAYERLRDQLVAEARASAKASARNDGRRSRSSHRVDRAVLRSDEIEAMFGLWLRALYRMHDSMTAGASRDKKGCGRGCGRDGDASESEYDSIVE